MTAQEKLKKRTDQNFHICVGLDTDINKLPHHLKDNKNPVLEFNKIIIDSTYKTAAAYKINYAFYEKDGLAGIKNLEKTLKYIPDDILTIADAKRGDIGNTSKMYAGSVFENLNFDAVTVNPYMGIDSVQPFLEFNDKLVYILALTSNKSADDFEKLELTDGTFVFQKVIEKVNEWGPNKGTYTINNDSLNERFNYSENKDKNTFRIITLGASYTYGLYVDTKNNWTEILEDILTLKIPSFSLLIIFPHSSSILILFPHILHI